MTVVIDYESIIRDTDKEFVDTLKEEIESELNKFDDNKILSVSVDKQKYYTVVVKTNRKIILGMYRAVGGSLDRFIDVYKVSLHRYEILKGLDERGLL